MTAKSKTTQKLIRAFPLFISAILIAACNSTSAVLPKEKEVATTSPQEIPKAIILGAQSTAQPASSLAFSLPDNLAAISPDNLQNILELVSVFPYFPPYDHISNDGSRIAIGDLQKIEIWDVESGEVLSSIPASLPDCEFGFDRYFRMNADGSFIALVNGQSIQVWQVGGGLVYDSPFFSGLTLNVPSCGVDLPELALSPDGKLLVVSGMAYSRTSVKRYFRVIDILANEVLYEWGGKKETLHGNLYTFYGLGFSDDGQYLQTFDPARFIRSEGDVHQAFRFWSVGSWQEVESTAGFLGESFQPGQLLFPWSDLGVIELKSKRTGETLSKIRVDGCLWDFPCETRFSPDGKQAVVLNRAGGIIQFKNDTLRTAFSVWDLTNNKEISRKSGVFRDLECVLVREDGNLLRADLMNTEEKGLSGWWTFRDHFDGMQVDRDGKVTFTPMAANSNNSQNCQFCATCTVDSDIGEITCLNGQTDSEGEQIYLKAEGGQLILIRQNGAGEANLGVIALSQMADLSKVRVRLLGYSMAKQTLFYCVDENLRQSGCYIYDPYREDIIAEPEDISYLRFSPDGLKAAFYNRVENAVFLYDLSSKTMTRKYPYQARGYPVNPVFSADGTKFFYVIQNLNNTSDLSVETLDAKTWKSYGRVSLMKAGITLPTVFSESSDSTIWAIAGKSGEVWLLSPVKGILLHRFQAHSDDIFGMAFSPDNKWLLTMGENGILKFWGIEQ